MKLQDSLARLKDMAVFGTGVPTVSFCSQTSYSPGEMMITFQIIITESEKH